MPGEDGVCMLGDGAPGADGVLGMVLWAMAKPAVPRTTASAVLAVSERFIEILQSGLT
jgi:hypothetical protein